MEDHKSNELLILYASQTGNALDAAERVGREAERRGCSVVIRSMDDFDAVSLNLNFRFLGLVEKILGKGDFSFLFCF